MKYESAPDLRARMEEIVGLLGMNHIDIARVRCFIIGSGRGVWSHWNKINLSDAALYPSRI